MEPTHFPEPESNAALYSAAARPENCTACGSSLKRRSPSTPSLCPNSNRGLNTQVSLSSNKTLDGFTKVTPPITSPLTWASADSTPTLRRCISDPVNSPGTNKPRDSSNYPLSPETAKIFGGSAWTPSPAKDRSSASPTVPAILRRCVSDPVNSPGTNKPKDSSNNPLSPPETAKIFGGSAWTPLPAMAGSSASATVPAILRRSFSGPSPKTVTPNNSIDLHNPKSKRVKRMEDGMTLMRQWLDEVMREGEDEEEEEGDGGYELDEKNGASSPKDHEPETVTEEAVSVELSGKVLIIHIKCPCGKGFQILLHENNCYYKLL